MRIIAGAFKGRRLQAPTWQGLRPTSDKLRETLFNILAPRMADARVLDLFAGTGALGLESLSRGAQHVVFVEHDPRAAALIYANAGLVDAHNRCVIIRDTAQRALHKPMEHHPFDVVMLDPPYDFEPLAEVVAAATEQLAPDGVLVLEHAARRSPPQVLTARAVRTVRSGDSALTLYQRLQDSSQ
jgi:16S rRNA (guanine(966)-N(2))-methyltransferase RsmD